MGADLCACDDVHAEGTSTAPPPMAMKIDRAGPNSQTTPDGLTPSDSRTKLMVPIPTNNESPPESPNNKEQHQNTEP